VTKVDVVGLVGLLVACSAAGAEGPTSKGSAGGAPSAGGGSAGQTSSGGTTTGGAVTGGTGVTTSAGGGSRGEPDAGGNGGVGEPELGPPNIVVVLLDDMGYSDLGAYGSEIRTLQIDALAQTGTRFRNFYVTPRCSPTRVSLLTGLYTQQAATAAGESLPPIRHDNNATLPEMLSAAGYRTYMAGKWHLGGEVQQRPSSRGFEHVYGIGDYGAGAEADKWDESKHSLVSKDGAIAPRSYGDQPGDYYQSTAFVDYALDYLTFHEAQNDDAPFFMYLAFNAPHFPVQADKGLIENAPAGAQSYLDLYGQGWSKTRNQRYQRMLDQGVIDDSFGLSAAEPFMTPTQQIPAWSSLTDAVKADVTRKQALYAASVESVDSNVGRVVARLKELGQFENTLIFVLSDNGGNYEGGVTGSMFGKSNVVTGEDLENMGQPGALDHMQVGGGWANVHTTPFRFYKHYTHGGGVRSPLVVSWPANTAAPGGWTDQVAHVIDLAPTILAAAHVSQPQQFDGHAVLPFEGTALVSTIADGAEPMPRQIGFEHETNRAWIDGRFKLVVRHENDDRIELYDLETDPAELNDLAPSEPVMVAAMVESWNAWATHVGVPSDRLLEEP
jgi:arylsulfatase A-like enzyme